MYRAVGNVRIILPYEPQTISSASSMACVVHHQEMGTTWTIVFENEVVDTSIKLELW